MGNRQFTMISPHLWRSARIRGLSDKGKNAAFYFLTCRHNTSAGAYELPNLYACADLGWDLETYLEIRAEVEAAGVIDVDADHEVVLVERWFQHCPPMNEKHATGTKSDIDKIPSDRLRAKALTSFQEAYAARRAMQAEKTSEKAAKADLAELAKQSIRDAANRLTTTNYVTGKSFR